MRGSPFYAPSGADPERLSSLRAVFLATMKDPRDAARQGRQASGDAGYRQLTSRGTRIPFLRASFPS
jgi:hypothetical protein